MTCTDKKKPAGDTNPPAGRTDSADFTSSVVKTAIISFVVGLAISSCSPAYAGAARGRICPGAEHTANSVSSPHDSGALPCPEFVFSGWVSRVRKAWGQACYSCSTTQPTRYSLNTGPSGFLSQIGAETMHLATSGASARAHIPTTEEQRAYALLQATSDATMARLYLQKGDIPAARRKTVQLLKALQALSNQPQGHAQLAQAASKSVASKGGSYAL